MGRFDFIKEIQNEKFNKDFPTLYEELSNVEIIWSSSKSQALTLGRRQNEIIIKALYTRLTGKPSQGRTTHDLIIT